MTYYKTCDKKGHHTEHGDCEAFAIDRWLVPVAEGAIIDINDEAALALAQGLHSLLADKADDNWRDLDKTEVHWRVVEARELLDGCSVASLGRAAAGEKP